MVPIDQIIDEIFPKELNGDMMELGALRKTLVAALPPDTSVEITTLMNIAELSVYSSGTRYSRVAKVVA